jgi:hypothetical protein
VSFEDRPHALTQTKVRVTYDRGTCAAVAVCAARAYCRRSVEKLRFPDRPQFGSRVLAVHCAALHGDGRANVVARCKVVQEIHHEVPVAGVIPQMMMRIDDRQLGIDDLLLLQAQPFGPNR